MSRRSLLLLAFVSVLPWAGCHHSPEGPYKGAPVTFQVK